MLGISFPGRLGTIHRRQASSWYLKTSKSSNGKKNFWQFRLPLGIGEIRTSWVFNFYRDFTWTYRFIYIMNTPSSSRGYFPLEQEDFHAASGQFTGVLSACLQGLHLKKTLTQKDIHVNHVKCPPWTSPLIKQVLRFPNYYWCLPTGSSIERCPQPYVPLTKSDTVRSDAAICWDKRKWWHG